MTFKALLVLGISIETKGKIANWAPEDLLAVLHICEVHDKPEEILNPRGKEIFDKYYRTWRMKGL